MNSAIERLLNLRVADVMRRDVMTLSADDTMSDAADRFLELGISGAPVVNSQQKCVGVLSGTDFVRKFGERLLEAQRSGQERVEEEMSRPVVSVNNDCSLIDAAREMCAQHVHRLPVVDRTGKLIGLVSSLDLVAALVAAMEE